MTTSKVYAIGQNRYMELCHNNSLHKITNLSLLSTKNITNILCGSYYTIFIDDNNNIFTAGANHHGQQGIYKSNTNTFTEPQSLLYFTQNNIQISKICVNPSSNATFYISNNQKVYASGYNIFHQLGINNSEDQYTPILIPSLGNKNIIDCKPAYRYSLALSKSNLNETIQQFCNQIQSQNEKEDEYTVIDNIPDGIIHLIALFHGFYPVYSTGMDSTGGCGHGHSNNTQWKPIETFVNKNIVQIGCGARHSMFLENNGILWTAGENHYGQLGAGHCDTDVSQLPVEIQYFKDQGIKIKDIKCGMYHNLALDENGNLYGWGYNQYGQCGDLPTKNEGILSKPMVFEFFLGMDIECVDCGTMNSYVKTKDGKYFVFGDNEFDQSLKFDVDEYSGPVCVNDVIKEKLNHDLKIESMSLGHNDTFFILSSGK